MDITLGDVSVPFRPWQSADGQVFEDAVALDTETTLIDDQRPWLTPSYVIGAACNGRHGYFVTRECLSEFLIAHRGVPFLFHNAPFDLAVIHQVAPGLDIYRRVELGAIWDTQLLHRLYKLGTEGHTAQGKGESTLETCAAEYLSVELPKDRLDSHGKLVRFSFDQYLNRPPSEIEPIYLEYLGKDTLATYLVFQQLGRRINTLLQNSGDVWGFVSSAWLREQAQKFGPLTHHIQLQGAIVLREITANGLTIDTERREELVQQLEAAKEEYRLELLKSGYAPAQKGSNKALQEILRRLAAKHPSVFFPRTERRGDYGTSEEALHSLKGVEPFVDRLIAYRAVEKLLSTFLTRMGRTQIHSSFNVLARTGRTTSYGEINAQNLPRDDRVRGCFVPSPGHVYVDGDYKQIEMATLAQSVQGQLGIPSQMGAAINAGCDLHRLVAAQFFGKSETEVTKDERQKAKPINFGKPGGMGCRTLQQYAATSYKVELTDAEVENLSESWLNLFPEMRTFLEDDDGVITNIATGMQLTPTSYYEHTDRATFLRHPENLGREQAPHPILGAMLLKVVKEPQPRTNPGRLYTEGELDFFWSRLAAHMDLLPAECHADVAQRRPSPALQRALMKEFGRGSVFTFTGRLRSGATYAARHNTTFQGLAADGAKLSLWLLWRAGYRIVNFIHDEILIEIPKQANLALHAEIIRSLMIQGMSMVVPDFQIGVEYAASDAWAKSAAKVFDDQGRLTTWQAASSDTSPATVSGSIAS
jgi:DNA polymerase I-like protein with 3'-5' exonuclease and polymerase domains